MSLHAATDRPLPGSALGAAPRPDRSQRLGAGGAVQDADRGRARRGVRVCPATGSHSPSATDGAESVAARRGTERPPPGPGAHPALRPRPSRAARARRRQPAISPQRAQLSPSDEGRPHHRGPCRRGADCGRAPGRSGAVSAGGELIRRNVADDLSALACRCRRLTATVWRLSSSARPKTFSSAPTPPASARGSSCVASVAWPS